MTHNFISTNSAVVQQNKTHTFKNGLLLSQTGNKYSVQHLVK